MATLIVFSGHGSKPGGGMVPRDALEGDEARVTRRERRRDSLQHPGPAQVEPVKMCELAVGWIRDHRGLNPVRIRFFGDSGEERGEPRGELLFGQYAANRVRLSQAGRYEVFSRWLVLNRAVAVLRVERADLLR